MDKKCLPWWALVQVMRDMLFNAHNVLVIWMDANRKNKPDQPEFWLCDYLTWLRSADWIVEQAWDRDEAIDKYVNDVFSVVGFVYEHCGRPFNDEDIKQEIFSEWKWQMYELFDLHDCYPDNWRTVHVDGFKPYEYHGPGVLYNHFKN